MTAPVVFDSRTTTDRRTNAGRRNGERERVTPTGVERAVVFALEPLLHHPDDAVKDAAVQVLKEIRKLNR